MKNLSRVHSSWYSVFFTTIWLGVAQFATIYGAPVFPGSALPNALRVAFAICAIALIVFLVYSNRKGSWTTKRAQACILFLWLATFVITVIFHVRISKSGLNWFPLPALKYYFLTLATLASGTYLLNLILMLGFGVMGLVMYQTLDFTHVEFAGTFEPNITIYFFFISLALFALKYRDELTIEKLHRENANLMAIKHVARVFLSVRDQANTPIQTLQVIAGLLKTRHPEAQELSESLDRVTEKLTGMNAYLGTFESKIPWGDQELLTDEEVLHWAQNNRDPADGQKPH
jgi:hypothetical protein